MPKRDHVTFAVKQYTSGKPWIGIEQLRGNVKLPGLVRFDLRDGTTSEQAEEIAKHLREHIEYLTLT
jgi:hypothetical protein